MANNNNRRTVENRTRANSAKARARQAGAAMPADRQTASNDVTVDILEFEYKGQVYEVDTDKLDDLDILDTLSSSLRRGLTMLLGPDQFEALRDQIKEDDPKGIFRASEVQDFFARLQNAIGPLR